MPTFVQVNSEDSNKGKKTKNGLNFKDYFRESINKIYEARANEAIQLYRNLLNKVPDSDDLPSRPLNN